MTYSHEYYAERSRRNAESQQSATAHREPWSEAELEQLVEFWDGTEGTLEEIAELLGRTIEACRQRYYIAVKAEGQGTRTHVSVTVQTRGWLIGYCFECGTHGDVYSDGRVSKCEDCRG